MKRKIAVSAQRSQLMSRIRSTNTKPELVVRKLLHSLGLRFRLHRKDLPGRPDLAFPKYRVALFVHGCFWHQHPDCRLASRPKTRTEYWGPKLASNVARDKRHARALEEMGWRIETIWECETRDATRLEKVLGAIYSRLR